MKLLTNTDDVKATNEPVFTLEKVRTSGANRHFIKQTQNGMQREISRKHFNLLKEVLATSAPNFNELALAVIAGTDIGELKLPFTHRKGKKQTLAIMMDTETQGFDGTASCIQALPVHYMIKEEAFYFAAPDRFPLDMVGQSVIITSMFDKLVALYRVNEAYIKGAPRIYIHNAAFDIPRILDGMKDAQISYILSGSQLITATLVYKGVPFTIYNTLVMMPSSLKKLAMSYAPQALKGTIDHTEGFDPQDERHIAYALQDVVTLLAVLRGYARELGKVFTDLRMTQAGEAFATMSNMMLDEAGREFKLKGLEIQENEFFRHHVYTGGRVYIKAGFELMKPVDVVSFDITSSYPHQMRTQALPIGAPARTSLRVLPKDAHRYMVLVKVEGYYPTIPILPYRTLDEAGHGVGTFYPTGTFSTVLTDVEFEYCQRNTGGAVITPIEYIYWTKEKAQRYLRPFVEHYITLKNQGDADNKVVKGSGDAKRMTAKGILNSPYGKLAQAQVQDPIQHYHRTDGVTHAPDREWLIAKREEESDREAKKFDHRNVPSAAFITAGARIALMEMFDFYGAENIIYCDTDSAKVLKSAVDKLGYPPCVQMDNDTPILGKWKNEGVAKGFMMVAPKVYTYINEDGEVELKSKGFPTNNILTLTIGNRQYQPTDKDQGSDKWEKRCRELIYNGILNREAIKASYGKKPVKIRTYHRTGKYADNSTKRLYTLGETESYEFDTLNFCYQNRDVQDYSEPHLYKYWTDYYASYWQAKENRV